MFERDVIPCTPTGLLEALTGDPGGQMSMENPPNIVFDDLTMAVDNLSMAVELLEQAVTEINRLKWSILAIHSSAQCFLVSALKGTNGYNVFRTNRADVREYFEALINFSTTGVYLPQPENSLETFLGLYKKAKKTGPDGMGHLMNRKAFQPRGQDDQDIRKLNTLRNKFVHFEPGGWILDPGYAVGPLKSTLRLIDFLAFESQNIVWILDAKAEEATKKLIERGKKALATLESTYLVSC